jgi:hypothetical protein
MAKSRGKAALRARLSFIFVFAVIGSGCASAPVDQTAPGLTLTPNVSASKTPRPVWQKTIKATVSQLSASRSGKRILLSTSSDLSPGRGKNRLRLLDGATGKVLWTKAMPQTVRAQAISVDGRHILVNTYDSAITMMDSLGKPIWSLPILGKPHFLNQSRKVLVFYDDDSQPKHLFDVFDFKGKPLATAMASEGDDAEPMEIAIAEDEKSVLAAYPNGVAGIYSTDGAKLHSLRLGSPIVSMAFTRGDGSQMAFLTGTRDSRALRVFDITHDGVVQTDSSKVSACFDTVRAFSDHLALYGNSSLGQCFAVFLSRGLKALHRWNAPGALPFSAPPVARLADQSATFISSVEREDHMLQIAGVKPDGSISFSAKIKADDGVYAYALSQSGESLAVASGWNGSGVIQYFLLKRDVNEAQ